MSRQTGKASMASSSSQARGLSVHAQSRGWNKARRKSHRNKGGQGHDDGRSTDELRKEIQHATQLLGGSQPLPADKRAELERIMATHQQSLAALEYERTKQKMIKKYHKIRFFERQKATRQLKRLCKQLAAIQSSAESSKQADKVALLQKQIHKAEVDLNYALYFPLDQDYVTLYPHKGEDRAAKESVRHQQVHTEKEEEREEHDTPDSLLQKETDKEDDDASGLDREKPPLWREVERRMAEETLEQLRNGSGPVRDGIGTGASASAKNSKPSNRKNAKNSNSNASQSVETQISSLDRNARSEDKPSRRREARSKGAEPESSTKASAKRKKPAGKEREGRDQARKRQRIDHEPADIMQEEAGTNPQREEQRKDHDDADGGFFEE